MNVEKILLEQARQKCKTIIFPEADFSDRTIEACKFLTKKKICKVLLVGDESSLALKYGKLDGMEIANPKNSFEQIAKKLYDVRKDKGMTMQTALELAKDPFYFATMMVHLGYADGMVGGAEVSTAQNLKPALQIIKGSEGLVSSCFLFYGKNKFTKGKPFFVSDAGLVESPTSEGLSVIAGQTVKTASKLLNLEPRVAFLSYSTKGSAVSENVEKVRTGYEIFRKKYPKVLADGELQLDASIVPAVAHKKAPESKLKGEANILIVPDINAGNITYKAIQYFGGLNAVGPITQGFKKPVNDLSRGCTVKDIIIISAITAIQCKEN